MGTAWNIKYFPIFEVRTEGGAAGLSSDIWGVSVFIQPIQAPEQSSHSGVHLPVAASCGVERLCLLLESMMGIFMDLVV